MRLRTRREIEVWHEMERFNFGSAAKHRETPVEYYESAGKAQGYREIK